MQTSYNWQSNVAIENYKLQRLIKDLQELDPSAGATLGRDAITQQLRPVVSEALRRGCTPTAILTLISGYGLMLDTRELGIYRP